MKSNQSNSLPVIAIVGASFAGLSALLKIRKRMGNEVTIKLFDSRTKFTHIPGLPDTILKDKQALTSLQIDLVHYYPEYIHATVDCIKSHQLITSIGEIHEFDYCVIATGSRTKFPHDDITKTHSYTVSYACDIDRLNTKLSESSTKNITVIGGGYTGIEIASIISQRKRADQNITLINSTSRFFPKLDQSLGIKVQHWFDKHDVNTIHQTKINAIQSDHLVDTHGNIIKSECAIVARGIKVNDEVFSGYITFEDVYQSDIHNHIYLCGDVAQNGLISTAHNAMFEGRRIGNYIVDSILQMKIIYPPLSNRDKLAVSLGSCDGIMTRENSGIYLPWVIGLIKKIIQLRVMIEFKYRVMFPF